MNFVFSHHIGNVIIPTDFQSIIFQRGRFFPPTSHGFISKSPRKRSSLTHWDRYVCQAGERGYPQLGQRQKMLFTPVTSRPVAKQRPGKKPSGSQTAASAKQKSSARTSSKRKLLVHRNKLQICAEKYVP